MRYRLGIDVGGTFSDFYLLSEDAGREYTLKVSSTQMTYPVRAPGMTYSLEAAPTTTVRSDPQADRRRVASSTVCPRPVDERPEGRIRDEVPAVLLFQHLHCVLRTYIVAQSAAFTG